MEPTPPLGPPAPPAAPIQPPLRNTGNDKIWSILCHLSVFLGIGFIILPLVVYLVMRSESEYVAANAKEALNFHISLMIYFICCIPLYLILIGIPIVIILGLSMFILSIVAAVKAADGGCYRYPLTLRLIT
ncbi:MAG: DUF4870 domain-containing protein [Verrucomicrobiota bacterium]|jgi:uncharacterized Tic20 family protein